MKGELILIAIIMLFVCLTVVSCNNRPQRFNERRKLINENRQDRRDFWRERSQDRKDRHKDYRYAIDSEDGSRRHFRRRRLLPPL